MVGIIDVGGANRAAFADGVLDYLQDHQVFTDYFIGVSAGAANGCSYVSRQRGRNLEFYTKYNLSSRAIGFFAWLKTRGSFIDLDYIYGTLSFKNGKCPIDYDSMINSSTELKIVATDVKTAESVYFDKTVMRQDDYQIIAASSCNPEACKPYKYCGREYFDGYVSDPLPVERAILDGCDRLIVLLTLPKDHMRSNRSFEKQAAKLKRYPAVAEKLSKGAEIYNRELSICLDLERERKALILYPEHNHIRMLEKDRTKILALYQEGYDSGVRVRDYLGV